MITLGWAWCVDLAFAALGVDSSFVLCFEEMDHEKILGVHVVSVRELMLSELLLIAELFKIPKLFELCYMLPSWTYCGANITSRIVRVLLVGSFL